MLTLNHSYWGAPTSTVPEFILDTALHTRWTGKQNVVEGEGKRLAIQGTRDIEGTPYDVLIHCFKTWEGANATRNMLKNATDLAEAVAQAQPDKIDGINKNLEIFAGGLTFVSSNDWQLQNKVKRVSTGEEKIVVQSFTPDI